MQQRFCDKSERFRLRENFRRFAAGYLLALPCATPFLIACVPPQIIGILFLFHALLFAPTLIPNGSAYGPVLRRFNTHRKEVYLTLDDGPDAEATPRVQQLLAAHNAKACFFLIGKKVRECPDLLQKMLDGGHEIGNHTASHRRGSFAVQLWHGVAREVDGCTQEIAAAVPSRIRWFRSPVGMTSPFVYPVLRSRDLQAMGWSVWARDAGSRDVAKIVKRVIRSVHPGAVIVMHPEWRAPDGSFPGLECLEKLLVELGAMGYRCVIPPTGSFT
jgi:peptidoglycan-N-acetylglucosamine deacetylase